MKIATIVGARPQFIKAAPVSRALKLAAHHEVLIHTGQHYDENMSEVFFRDLEMNPPNYNLGVGSGRHGEQTAEMLKRIEILLVKECPDWVIVYGDTNSTLAGVLASSKLGIRTAHVEAGLRSHRKTMPEELNRVVADHLSSLLLCPTATAVDNLKTEGVTRGVYLVGDVMEESLLLASRKAASQSNVLRRLGLSEKGYLLATVHRAENTDDIRRLGEIINAFRQLAETIVFPAHPRTRKRIMQVSGFDPGGQAWKNLRLIDPLGFLDMVMLEKSARVILTDSGGVQKEAHWFGVPCVTLRDETEWVETVQLGWNRLAGADAQRIIEAVRTATLPTEVYRLAGEGVSRRCVEILEQCSIDLRSTHLENSRH